MQITTNTRTAEGRQAVPTRKIVIRNVRTKAIGICLSVSKVGAVIRGLASAVDIAWVGRKCCWRVLRRSGEKREERAVASNYSVHCRVQCIGKRIKKS
jgi:hypothetical protein